MSLLVACAKFVKGNAVMDEFMFCQELKNKTRAKEVSDLVNAFLVKFNTKE